MTGTAQSFHSTSEEVSRAHLSCPESSFPVKKKFPCTCNSAILGLPREQYFNFKILASCQEGGFLLGISIISVTAFFSPHPCLSLETSRAQLLRRCDLSRHTNNGDFFFFPEQVFIIWGFCLFVTCPTNFSLFLKQRVVLRK